MGRNTYDDYFRQPKRNLSESIKLSDWRKLPQPQIIKWIDNLIKSDEKEFLIAYETLNKELHKIKNIYGGVQVFDSKIVISRSRWKNFVVTFKNGEKESAAPQLKIMLEVYWDFYYPNKSERKYP